MVIPSITRNGSKTGNGDRQDLCNYMREKAVSLRNVKNMRQDGTSTEIVVATFLTYAPRRVIADERHS